MNLRNAAKDQPCLIRIPGYCNHDASTSCLCHSNLAGEGGMGMKANDIQAAIGCSGCHDVIDGRVQTHFTRDEIKAMFGDGVIRTLGVWVRAGILKW
jgi:hypothetical protein